MVAGESTNAPGPIGRAARIVWGLVLAAFAVFLLVQWAHALAGKLTLSQNAYSSYVVKQNIGLYLVALIGALSAPMWSRGTRLTVTVVVISVAVAMDYALGGNWWGLPLAVLLSMMVIAAAIFFAAAHVLAGLIANPG